MGSSDFHRTIGREVFRTPDSATNPRLDCRKLKPGNGTLDLSRIFNEAVSKPDGLSSILEKDNNSTSGRCRFDYVEILESNGKGVKLCGDDVRSGQKFHSEGKEMTVRFHSDESITKKGFKATWKEVPK